MTGKQNGDRSSRLSNGDLRALRTRLRVRVGGRVVFTSTLAQLVVQAHLLRRGEPLLDVAGVALEVTPPPE